MASRLSISIGNPSSVHRIDASKLHIDLELNGRKFQPKPERVRSLAESIIRDGQEQPIVIRKLSKDTHTVVLGYTRYAAVKLINEDPELRALAGLGEGEIFPIQAITADVNEQEAFLKNLAENNERNPLSPIDHAHNHRKLRERLGWTNAQIAKYTGLTPARVSQLANLLLLDDEQQLLVHEKAITASNGIALAQLMPDMRDEIIANASKPVQLEGSVDANGLEGVDFETDIEHMEQQPAITIDNKEVSKQIAKASGKTVGRSLKEIKDTLKEIAQSNIHSDDVRGVCSATLKWIVGEAIIDDVLDSITDIINSVNV